MKKFFLFIAIIMQITACKKNNTQGGTPPSSSASCRIIKIDVTPYTPDYFILKYNNDGKLIAIEDGPGGNMKKEITYQDHSYTLMEYNGPSLVRTVKGDLTDDNKVIRFTEKQFEAGVLRHTVVRSFDYYTSGELKRQQVDIDTDINYMTMDYDWQDGNLRHEMLNGKPGPPAVPTVHTYNEYDAQKNLPIGNGFAAYDLTRFGDLLGYGRFVVKNKNPLIRQTFSQQNTADFSWVYEYEFDAKGNVSLIKGTRPNTTTNGAYTISYSYNCD